MGSERKEKPFRLHAVSQDEENRSKPAPCLLLAKGGKPTKENRFASKLGGLPYIESDDSWPVCKDCGRPLAFVFQVRGDDAPAFFGEQRRLFQLFYCVGCAPWWDTDGRMSRLRWQNIDETESLLAPKHTPLSEGYSPALQQLGFRSKTDYPAMQDLAGDDIHSYDLLRLAEQYPCREESKFGGYPAWIREPDIPLCGLCGRRMNFIGQLSGGGSFDFPFGENERLYMFECPDHCSDSSFGLTIQAE